MATSLLDWIMDLMQNENAREAFESNPQAAMASAGLTNICGADVADSVPFLLDHPSVKTVSGETFRPDSSDAGDQIRYIVNNYTYKDVDNFAAPSDNENENESDVDVDNRNEVEVENEISDLPGDGGGDDPDIDQSDSEVEGDQTATSTETDNSVEVEDDNSVEVETDDNTVGNRNVPGDDNTIITGDGSGEDIVNGSVTEIEAEIEDIVGDDNVEGGLIAVNDVLDTEDIDVDVLSELVETDDILRDSPILNDSLNDSIKDLINGPLL